MNVSKSMLLGSALVLGTGPEGCAVMTTAGMGALDAPVELVDGATDEPDTRRDRAHVSAKATDRATDELDGVPETWTRPAEAIMPGLDGAAQLLAVGRDADALDHLPPGGAAPGTPAWFRRGAIAGRAHARLGNYREAVDHLRPLVEHEDLAKHLPAELVEFELARVQISLGRGGTLARDEAETMLSEAADVLARAAKRKPNRHVSPIRVAYLEALFGMEGTDEKSRKRAANKAIKQADRVLAAFPNHADVGYWQLDKARAQVRAGKVEDAAQTLRELMIVRAGEPEAAMAWVDLVSLAEREPKVELEDLSTEEELRRAYHARELRRVKTSRVILDELLADDELPAHRRREAMHSRAWTAYKQRDFDTCASDLRPLYEKTPTADYRTELVRCLERGEHYDEAIEIHVEIANDKSAGRYRRPAALWTAIDLAVRAGLYDTASELLVQYEKEFRGYVSERRFLRAWLAYRTGDRDGALAGFEELEKHGGSEAKTAKYFRGKLMVRSQNEDGRASGAAVLREIVAEDPLGYYGLQARQRLLDAGFDPGPEPSLEPVADEAERATWVERQALYRDLVANYGQVSDALVRGAQLHDIGWIDEARRELRYVADEFSNTEKRLRGIEVRVPRSESLEVGLSWEAEWDYPKPTFGSEGRAVLRDADQKARLQRDLRQLAAGLDEPYRWIKLTDADAGDYKARWHPRAYRAHLEKYAAKQEIDPTHLWGLMYTESRFRRYVVSYVGARGALQIMPWTCRQLMEITGEFRGRLDPDVLYDIDTNSRLAALYIAELLRKFHGQAPLAYASYNGGPSNVARWVKAKSRDGSLEMDDFIEEIVFDESRRYAKRVMEVQAAYSLLYGEGLPRWNNEVDPQSEDNIDF